MRFQLLVIEPRQIKSMKSFSCIATRKAHKALLSKLWLQPDYSSAFKRRDYYYCCTSSTIFSQSVMEHGFKLARIIIYGASRLSLDAYCLFLLPSNKSFFDRLGKAEARAKRAFSASVVKSIEKWQILRELSVCAQLHAASSQ